MAKDEPTTTSPQTYQRLQNQLAQIIAMTKPGERLLAEPELAKQLGVSRATLREAMRTFEGQGLIRRRQGVGTFVVGHPQVIETGLEVLQSIESLAKRIGLEVSMGDLKISKIEANAEQARSLQVEAETPLLQVSRVILTDDRPVAYLVDILPQNLLSQEELQDGFNGSVLDFLMKRKQPALTKSLTDIQAVAASSSIARALEIQRGDVLLMFVARLFVEDGRVIDFSKSYFLPGYFHFQLVRKVA
ncbi:MAG: GntR family transcriptional regulator [Chloroflexi bacterium]|nr:GntR family transcriptional regulator [Chloroflexota bacterium]